MPRAQSVSRWVERLLVVVAAVCVAWLYATWKEATFFQLRARSAMVDFLDRAQLPGESGRVPASAVINRDDSLIGMLDIPRLSLSVAVLEGDDARALRLGAGHVPETSLPWKGGNTAVAGHRDTFFRALKDVRVGDELVLGTRHGAFRYRVTKLSIVGPYDVSVLAPSADATLTLITCYPFDFLGLAPDRFIVRAEQSRPDVQVPLPIPVRATAQQPAVINDGENKALSRSISDDHVRQAIAASIRRSRAFSDYAGQHPDPVLVMVRRGYVTLTGVVGSELQRRMAESLAREGMGVIAVDNQLRLDQ